MRARFGIVERLGFYPPEDLQRIVTRSADILGIAIEPGRHGDRPAEPRHAPGGQPAPAPGRDYAQVKADGRITAEVADAALGRLNVDEFGLDDMDARILSTIIEKFGGGPVGLGTVAVAVGRSRDTPGRIRALPHSAGISGAHPARPLRDAARVSALWPHASRPAGLDL